MIELSKIIELSKLISGPTRVVVLASCGVVLVLIILYVSKRFKVKEIKVGPFTFLPIPTKPVKRIDFLSQPKDASGRPALLTHIRVRIYDEDNKPISGRRVVLQLSSCSGKDYLRGILDRSSDNTGTVSFSGLEISRAGQYQLVAKSEEQYVRSIPFEITPPGFDTNFSDKSLRVFT